MHSTQMKFSLAELKYIARGNCVETLVRLYKVVYGNPLPNDGINPDNVRVSKRLWAWLLHRSTMNIPSKDDYIHAGIVFMQKAPGRDEDLQGAEVRIKRESQP